jgi:signal transduction histidine kinase/DNA-binding response OmpR family regulator
MASALLLTMFLGLIPDRLEAISQGRVALTEAIAESVSNALSHSDVAQARSTLSLMVRRNSDLLSAVLRKLDGEVIAMAGEQSSEWDTGADHAADSQVQIPMMAGPERWGQLELRFKPLTGSGWKGITHDPQARMIAFAVTVSFFAFYVYLGRALRELDPSRAIPGRVRTAFDTMVGGLLVVDTRGYIILANQAFADMVSDIPEKLIGRETSALPWLDSAGNAQGPQAHPWTAAVQSGIAVRNGRVCLRDRNNKLHSFIVNSSPVLSAGGRHDGVLISFEDITQLQDKEVELRTAQHEAEAASRAKTDFLTNMSHEIRTPMNAILGFTELLQRGYQRDDRDLHRHLNIIHSSGKHLLELINDVLDLAKVESGRLELETNQCQVHGIVREVVAMLSIQASKKNISLRFNCRGQIPEIVTTDPGRLRQTITNLVGNAIKFTEKGEVSVTLELRLVGNRRVMALDVADTGIGLAEEKLESIFDPFVQAEASTTRRFGGSGLGLTISRRFARAMGGDIVVQSQLGTGSLFSFTFDPGSLQGVRMLSSREAVAYEQSRNENQGAWEFPPCHVLVVDDGDANRELVRVVLQRAGIRVSEAQNGEEALRIAEQERLDAILMDMQMPVMDGYTATRGLRSRGIQTPIVAMTAHAMAGVERDIVAAGCTGYLAKPVTIEVLLGTLAGLVGGRRSHLEPLKVGRTEPILMDEGRSDDLAPLISRWADDPELHSVARTFAMQVPEKLRAMDRALGVRDFATLALLAHWLKGSGGTAGFPDFTAPAKLLEDLARGERLDQIDQVMGGLHQLADRMAAFYGDRAQQTTTG